MTTFVRLLDTPPEGKAAALMSALRDEVVLVGGLLFDRDPMAFTAIPGTPFAYWVSAATREVFARLPRFERPGQSAKQGLATTDDFRFLRIWFEVPSGPGSAVWYPFAKGGSFSQYYCDVHLVVDWRRDGAQSWAIYQDRKDVVGGIIKNPDFYFRPGLTWPRRTNGLSFRALPRGSVFADKGPAVFVDSDEPETLLALLALLNSNAYSYLVGVQLARTELAQSFEVGLVQQTPVPVPAPGEAQLLAGHARQIWSLRRFLDYSIETSHAFVLPSALYCTKWIATRDAVIQKIDAIQSSANDLVFGLYALGGEERLVMDAASRSSAPASAAIEPDEDEFNGDLGDATDAGETLLRSWFVGVAFGRFDVRLATGQREPPPEPEPFDPLPIRSPGMWPEGEPRDIEPPSILVDDPGHKLDLTRAVASVAEHIGAEEPVKLRSWLAKEFFPLHIKMYSKSRRKAPIYWQLGTPTASYSVWLYLHAFTTDTFFHVQELVNAKADHEDRVLERLRGEQERDGSTSASRKALAAQETFVDELRGMLEEVKRVKPLWKPDLDDGVAINFAPLWHLVPHHRPWQKELRTTWDLLAAGAYDWTHLAMHLWPGRVVPKCATDRSLAIAHDLEEMFWLEDDGGKWKPRPTPIRPIAQLVAERTSAAVEAARDSLVATANAGGGSGKTRRKRATWPRSRR